MLQVRHVARDAVATRRSPPGMGVLLDAIGLARVTIQALAVVEATLEPPPPDVAVVLAVRLVTVHARHRAVAIAIAEQVVQLIAEGPNAAIRIPRLLSQPLEPGRVVLGERPARQIVPLQPVLEPVTGLAIDAQVLVPRGVSLGRRVVAQLDLAPVTLLAVGEA